MSDMTKLLYQDDFTIIYCGRIEEVICKLPKVDLVLTDPPYGIDKKWKRKYHGGNGTTKLWGDIPEWDRATINADLMESIMALGKESVIWGGNFYPLPPSRCWLVWDKMQSNRGADCELAWTNLDKPPKVFRMARIDAYKNKAIFVKKHGAEKPVQLSEWILNLVKPTSILDSFMGTGNSLVAARARGIKAIGVDMDNTYCEEAIKRIKTIIPNSNRFSVKRGFWIQ